MSARLMLGLAAVAFLTFAAHALRLGDPFLCAVALATPLLLLTRHGAARLVCAAALLFGAAGWAAYGLDLVRLRLAFGEPWLRLALILAAAGAAALGSGLWLLGARARALFPREAEREGPQAAAFLLTAGLLAVARAKAGVALLLADRFLPGSGALEIFGLALYAAWLAGKMLDPAAHRRLRPRIWTLFSAVFFLQLGLGLAGLRDFLMTGRLHLPVPALILAGPIYRGGGPFMPILFLAAVLLVGPAWCSHLCYIGAWDDRASRLSRKPPRVFGRAWTVGGRLATLVLTCGGALVLHLAGVPSAAAALWAAGFGLVGVGVMLFVSRRLGVMVHCTAFCPIGLAGDLLGRLSPWRMAIDRAACTRCGACARACRYSALGPAEILSGRPGLSCTLCGDCVAACGREAMGYRLPGVAPRLARAAFLALVASLHAVFLGVARI